MFNKTFIESEIFRPIKDFMSIKSQKELWNNVILMIIVSVLGVILIICSKNDFKTITSFYENVIDAEINVISLLLSFSIAYLTMLITASGNNIERLKSCITEVKIDNTSISAYQILLIELTFTIYLEIILLFILILNKFLFLYNGIFIKTVFFIGELIILIDVISILINLIKNIYFSFWKN